MQVTLLLFGQVADIIGTSHLTIDNVPDTKGLEQYLYQHFPALSTTKYVIAVDKKMIRENTPLQQGITVALLPPFSGG